MSAISCNQGSLEDSTGNNILPDPKQDISIKPNRVFTINFDSLEVKPAVVKTVEAGQLEKIPYTGFKPIKAGVPNIIDIDTSMLKVITPGEGKIPDPREYVLPEPTYDNISRQRSSGKYSIQYGDTVFAPVIVKARLSEPIQALPMSIKDNAVCMIQYLSLEHGLKNPTVQTILEDKQGNIWLGFENEGICRYDGKSLNFYAEQEGLVGSSDIQEIYEDSKGNIWVAARNGLSMFDGNTFTNYFMAGLDFNPVWSIIETENGDMWFGSYGNGLARYDGNTWTHYTENEGLSDHHVSGLLEDANGNIWISTNYGVNRFDGRSFIHFTERDGLSSNIAGPMIEDRDGKIWIGSHHGINIFDGRSFARYSVKEGLSNEIVDALCEDHAGNIWIGTWGGVNMYDGKNFMHYTKKEGFTNNVIHTIKEDNCNNIWLGTRGGGVVKLQRGLFTYFNQLDIITERIFSITEDKEGRIWFATPNLGILVYDDISFQIITIPAGLYPLLTNQLWKDKSNNIWIGLLTRGLLRYDGKYFTLYVEKDRKEIVEETIMDNPGFATCLLEDKLGNIWQGTLGEGLKIFDGESFTYIQGLAKTDGSTNYRDVDEEISSMIEDNKGNIWFSVLHDKPVALYKYNYKSVTQYLINEGSQNIPVSSLFEDKFGNLWIGTYHHGIMKFDGKSIIRFSDEDGLSNNIVSSIIGDDNGNIWVGTFNGLSVLIPRPDSSYSITSFGYDNGLKELQFNIQSVLLDKQNRLWWGTGDKITMLDLNDFEMIPQMPRMQLNNLYLNQKYLDYRAYPDGIDKSKSALFTDDRRITGRGVKFSDVVPFYNYPTDLELPHHISHLTFKYSAIDWTAPGKLRYQYYMEGLEEEWSPLVKDNFADYRNVPPGKYTFMVRAIGQAGIWSETFEYPFSIRRPWWFRWWAFTFYAMVFLLFARYYIRYIIGKERIKAEMQIKQAEVEKMQEMDQMKSRFFANISHEFRTPLTLLLGPINDLLKRKPGKDEMDWNLLRVMQRNASRLQRLINQLLDLSKLETGKLNLQVAEGNLTEFVRRIVLSFLSLAESENIIYKHDLPEIPGQVYFDGDKLEKILTNLLSNAFKFTPEGGQISVTMNYLPSEINDPPQMVEISVRDSGKGISKDQIDKIFDRFYMVSDSDTREAEGTGIGLSLTKELVELYRGEIRVDSEHGKGSIFTVKLPVSEKHFNEDEIVAALKEDQDRHELHDAEAGFIGPDDSELQGDRMTTQDASVVLVVEDNMDLRKYIARNLDASFSIMEAENGRIGLDKAIETIPDLVISDLMMPEMDGMEMCKRLKSDERTSHIPVIMLTAKADRESKLEGLETGADDYIIKPFDAEELHIKVNNLIAQRRRLREKYRKEFLTGGMDIELLPYDEQFLSKVSETILDHLQESEFNIESLSGEIGMSRSQLYKKMLAITGFTPTEYLRNIRLKQAAHMLREKLYNITQVAYNVGFSNPSYFSECFRNLFGSTPSEYIKKN